VDVLNSLGLFLSLVGMEERGRREEDGTHRSGFQAVGGAATCRVSERDGHSLVVVKMMNESALEPPTGARCEARRPLP
jgi:hypothetical protein